MNIQSLQKGLIAHYPLDKKFTKNGTTKLATTFESGSTGWNSTNVNWTGDKPKLLGTGVDSYMITLEDMFFTGKTYRVIVDCEVMAGSAFAGPQNTSYAQLLLNSTGKYEYIVTTDTDQNFLIDNIGSGEVDITINSVYIYEVLAKDVTPYGNDGTINGATLSTGVKGESEGSYSFDGVDDYISVPDNEHIRLYDKFSVSSWIKVSGDTGKFRIFFHKNWGLNKYPQFMVSNNNKIDWRAQHDYTYGVLSTDAVVLNTWYHVVGTYDSTAGANNSKLYVNGVYNNAETRTGEVTNSSDPLVIGFRTLYPFNGNISDVRIYNRALSEDEIKLLYDSYKPKASIGSLEKGLVGYWALDNRTGADDLSGYGNDGIGNGEITVGGASDRKGLSGGATSFDGSNDYIINNLNLNSLTEVSMSMWVKKASIGTYAVIGQGTGSSSFPRIELLWYSNGYLYGEIGPDHNTWVNVLAPEVDTNWHLISMAYNGNGVTNTDKIKIYFDGELLTLTGFSGTILFSITATESFLIGMRNSQYFNGFMNDVRVYDRVLSQKEITLLYDQYKPKGSSNVGSLNKGLVLDMPLTTKTQDTEATENLGNDPLFETSSIPNNTSSGTYGSWTFGSWSGDNHELVNSEIFLNKKAIKIIGTDNTGSNDFWDIGWRDNTDINTKYTLSFYAKGIGTIQTRTQWGEITEIILTEELIRYSQIFTKSSISTQYNYIAVSGLTNGQWAYFEAFQLEQKDHPTPFVDGIRNEIIKDKTPYKNDGTIYGATVGNDSTSFDGVDDYIDLGTDINNLGIHKTLSISVWVKRNTINTWDGIFGSLGSGGIHFQFAANTGINIYIYGPNAWINGTGSPCFTDLMNIIITFDGTNLLSYYNGVLYESVIASSPNADIGNTSLVIGRVYNLDRFFDGDISNLKIYNRALSVNEVQLLYEKGRS